MRTRQPVLELIVAAMLLLVRRGGGHGRLVEPPSRSSMWRLGYNTPRNYQDNELFCGGFQVSARPKPVLSLVRVSGLNVEITNTQHTTNMTKLCICECKWSSRHILSGACDHPGAGLHGVHIMLFQHKL